MTTLSCGHCGASFTHDHYCPVGVAKGLAPADPGQIALLWNAVMTLQAQVQELQMKMRHNDGLADPRSSQHLGSEEGAE